MNLKALCLYPHISLEDELFTNTSRSLNPIFGVDEIITRIPDLFERLPKFQNLKFLMLIDLCRGPRFHAIIKLLGRLPHIETLVWKCNQIKLSFSMSEDWDEDFALLEEEEYGYVDYELLEAEDWDRDFVMPKEEYSLNADSALSSIFDHLKFFELRDPQGCELRFLRFLLKRAIVLTEVVIRRIDRCLLAKKKLKKVTKLNEKLLNFPRASSSVSFLFL